jgi:hypothetical protein
MNSAVLVPHERFEEYRQKLNRLRRIPHAASIADKPQDEHEVVAMAAVAVRNYAAADGPPQDLTD